MKNKQIQSKKSQPKEKNALKAPMNIKNRDHLRKKLKGLLEKHLVSTDIKISENIHRKANSIGNKRETPTSTSKQVVTIGSKNKKSSQPKKLPKQTNKDKVKENGLNKRDTNNPKSGNKTSKFSCNNKRNEGESIPIKSKNVKKPISKNVNSNGNRVALKRKLDWKVQPSTKASKSSDHSNNSNVDPTNKKQHLKSKKVSDEVKKPQTKKTENGDAKALGGKSKKANPSKNISKSRLNQKSKMKNQYVQGRGPLRPSTSDSEFNDDSESPPFQLKQKCNHKITSQPEFEDVLNTSPSKTKLNIQNSEQALMRANNHFEASSSDNNQNENAYQNNLDFLFNSKYNEEEETTFSTDEESYECTDDESEFEYSDEESELESELESSDESYEEESSDGEYWDDYSSERGEYFDDESYQPPGDIPEDIYIYKGTAVKYELEGDDIGFDSDSQYAQIIEIPTKTTELTKESTTKTDLTPFTKPKQNKKTASKIDNNEVDSDDSCPDLVPIESIPDNSDLESESSSSSHSCFSSCGCDSGSSDDNMDTSGSKERYNPMAPEIITGTAEMIDDMEIFFETNPNKKINAVSSTLLEEIGDSNNNPLQFKVYTINNEVLSTSLLANKPLTTNEVPAETAQKSHNLKLSSAIENSCFEKPQTINEVAEKIQKESSPVNKTTITTCKTPSYDNKSPQITFSPATANSSPSQNMKTKSSHPNISSLFVNAINCNHVIVLLKEPLYLYGTVKLKLLAGSLEIFGYNPKRNEILEIFSPRGYSSLKIEPSRSDLDAALNEKELLSLSPFFIRSDLEEIIEKFEPTKNAIVIMERNDRSKKVNMLRKYMVEHLFPNMNSIQSDRPFYSSEFLLRCIISTNSQNALYINPDWRTIKVNNNSKTMIIGGKSVGKSTLGRYLINKNLNIYPKILLVDLDIGQPEMFVPQTVSVTTLTAPLLGPGYFFNKQPDKSFLVGHISVMQSLKPYIDSLKSLFEYCNGNREYNDIPWIVNTMGYNKGFGDEIISVVCSLLQPTNIVELQSEREINNFDVIMSKDNVKVIERNIVGDMFSPSSDFVPQHQWTLIKSIIPSSRNFKNDWSMKPKDMRLAMILSRLSSILAGHAEWITDVKPFCASIDDLNIINMGEDQLDKENLVKTLVGNLIYLCRMESGKACECFGIGIVRGIDYRLRQIYLLPAISHDLLVNVNCVAICGIPLPSSILLNQGPKVKGAATYVYNTLNEAASMYIKHMYKQPQQYPSRKFI